MAKPGTQLKGKRRRTPESYVKQAVEDYCAIMHIPCFRMNAGDIFIPGRGRIRLNEAGTADLLLAPNCPYGITGRPIPKFLWVECKRPSGGEISREQLAFADRMRNREHTYLIVTDVRQLIEWLKEERGS